MEQKMKNSNIKPNKAIRILLIAGLSMTSIAPTVLMAGEKEEVLIIDGADGMLADCLLTSGSTVGETATTVSCTTSGGQKTTCEKGGAVDACDTTVTERGTSTTNRKPFGNELRSSSAAISTGTAPEPTIVKPFVKLHIPMKLK